MYSFFFNIIIFYSLDKYLYDIVKYLYITYDFIINFIIKNKDITIKIENSLIYYVLKIKKSVNNNTV